MKTKPIKPKYFDGLHRYRKEDHFYSQISAIEPSTGKEAVTCRFYAPLKGSTVYCCIWINGKKHSASGSGKAGGYGYHKPSAALQTAIETAGFKLSEDINGRGDSAMYDAIESLAKTVTGLRKLHIVKAHS